MAARSSSGDMEARRGSSIPILYRVRSSLARADAQRLLHRRDEDLAVADPPGVRRRGDRLDDALGKAVLDDHFEPDLGQEIDDIFGAAIELGMPFLAAEPLGFGDGDSGDADLVKRFLHLVELERLDDRLDLLHVALRLLRCTISGPRRLASALAPRRIASVALAL